MRVRGAAALGGLAAGEVLTCPNSHGFSPATGAAKARGLVPWKASAAAKGATMLSPLVVAKPIMPCSAATSA